MRCVISTRIGYAPFPRRTRGRAARAIPVAKNLDFAIMAGGPTRANG
jgi:hypothetical protein